MLTLAFPTVSISSTFILRAVLHSDSFMKLNNFPLVQIGP